MIYVFKRNLSRKLSRFNISLNTELASLVKPKIYFYLWARFTAVLSACWYKNFQPPLFFRFRVFILRMILLCWISTSVADVLWGKMEVSDKAQSCTLQACLWPLRWLGSETGSAGDGSAPFRTFSDHAETPEHPSHRLQNSAAPYEAFPALKLWVHAGEGQNCHVCAE